jgi:hypothetical protein
MERRILPSAEVVRELKHFIPVELYTDRGTPDDNRNQALEGELVRSIALPFYVIVSPQGKVIDIREGGGWDPKSFAGFLRMAQNSFIQMARN